MDYIKTLNIDTNQLDEKKQQTSYKIKYVKEYIIGWLQVSVNRENIKYINFIDCMCNAGIYKDNDLGTSMEVLQIFIDSASKFTSKEFHIYLNDYDKKRIEIIKTLSTYFLDNKITTNLKIHYNCDYADAYIQNFTIFNETLISNASTVLFVDPYNFQSIKLLSIKSFLKHYYCELYYNIFTSDYIRNKNNSNSFYEILNTTEELETVDDMIEYIRQFLKTEKMKYSFSYGFRNCKNVEIYQILFVTPNIRGLEKLKEAIIKVFKGVDYYRNQAKKEECQQSLFVEDDDEKNFERNILNYCGKEIQNKLCNNFQYRTIDYSDIEIFVLENSPLSDSKIIEYVLKPLISNGKIRKCNKTKNHNNYKDDSYIFIG